MKNFNFFNFSLITFTNIRQYSKYESIAINVCEIICAEANANANKYFFKLFCRSCNYKLALCFFYSLAFYVFVFFFKTCSTSPSTKTIFSLFLVSKTIKIQSKNNTNHFVQRSSAAYAIYSSIHKYMHHIAINIAIYDAML